MIHVPLLIKDNFENSRVATQVHPSGDFSVNHALTAVAREVVGLLQHAYPVEADASNPAGTVTIRASRNIGNSLLLNH